jgi:alpha-glucosidase
MKPIKLASFFLLTAALPIIQAQDISVKSPDNKIVVSINNSDNLSFSVTFNGRTIIEKSSMGFEFKDEPPMKGGFRITGQSLKSINETWKPVVRSKHAEIANNYNELQLLLKEKDAPMRQMELYVRAYNDGAAFRYKLSRAGRIGDRQITKELTTFCIPGEPKAWIVEYPKGYSSSNEAEFFDHPLSYITEKSIAGMPLLMEYGNGCWVAIT